MPVALTICVLRQGMMSLRSDWGIEQDVFTPTHTHPPKTTTIFCPHIVFPISHYLTSFWILDLVQNHDTVPKGTVMWLEPNIPKVGLWFCTKKVMLLMIAWLSTASSMVLGQITRSVICSSNRSLQPERKSNIWVPWVLCLPTAGQLYF